MTSLFQTRVPKPQLILVFFLPRLCLLPLNRLDVYREMTEFRIIGTFLSERYCDLRN